MLLCRVRVPLIWILICCWGGLVSGYGLVTIAVFDRLETEWVSARAKVCLGALVYRPWGPDWTVLLVARYDILFVVVHLGSDMLPSLVAFRVPLIRGLVSGGLTS